MSSPVFIFNETLRHRVVDYLTHALPNIMAIYGFGSQIHGTANAESDLDLAVLVAGFVEPVYLWQLANELAEQVNCDVDLLDLRAASTVMQYQVITTGQLLSPCSLEVELFECFVLSEKTEFDTARMPLLKQIAEEGRIYAG